MQIEKRQGKGKRGKTRRKFVFDFYVPIHRLVRHFFPVKYGTKLAEAGAESMRNMRKKTTREKREKTLDRTEKIQKNKEKEKQRDEESYSISSFHFTTS